MSNLKLTTGKVFCSSYTAFVEKNWLPTTPLPHYHRFWSLWQDHCSSFQTKGADDLINALIAIKLQDPTWRTKASADKIRTHQEQIRSLLFHNPPDIILLANMIPPNDYGVHRRREPGWRFICINEAYVDLWTQAEEQMAEERLALAAVLRASIDHEIGHWVQSHALHAVNFCVKRFGYFSGKSKPLESYQDTLKSLSVPWNPKPEAGQFVEVCSRGGIIGYNLEKKQAYIITGRGKSGFRYLTPSDLEQYRRTTNFPSKVATGSLKMKMKIEDLFPYEDADCPPLDAPRCLLIK